MSSSNTLSTLFPPQASKQKYQHINHDSIREDPYYWMRNRDNPDVITYIEAENSYTEAKTSSQKPLRKKLFNEILSRIQEDDISVPVEINGFWYYHKTLEGKPYGIYCRRKGSMDSSEEVLLDLNAIADGCDYFNLGTFSISHDQTKLAYSIDITGREIYELCIKDLNSGQLLKDLPNEIIGDVIWSKNDDFIFYT